MKVIRIKSQREGFRRCGIAHSTEWKEYPAQSFTKDEIERLKNEPTLWVEEVEKKAPDKEPEDKSEDKK